MAGPRIRTLKPEILEDEKIAMLSDSAFRLFTSMVVLSDDWGNVRADVRWLQGQVWWAHEQRPNILLALIELCRAPLISVYGVRGGTYAHLLGWEKHQRIDNRGKNRVPKTDDPDAKSIHVDESFGARVAETRGEPRRLAAGSGMGMGEEQEGDRDSAVPEPRQNKSTEARKHKLPDGWMPDRSAVNLEAERVSAARGVDLEAQLKNLRDWAVSNNAKKADWNATWRNWTRNAKPSGPQRHAQSALDLQLERVRMLEEQERNGESE
jgi:hypothetical protein